jgi:hypothetical protein
MNSTIERKAGAASRCSALLGDISDDELDHLSKGLELNFGAQLWRPKGMCGLMILETEDGTRHGISPACTVDDAWRIAEAAWESGDPVPPKVDGVRNILAQSPNGELSNGKPPQ